MRRFLVMVLISFMMLQAVPVAAATLQADVDTTYVLDPDLSNDVRKEDPRSRDTGIPLDYDDVLLIVNDNSQMSKDIADYFVAKRPILQNNICNITTSSSETVDFTVFTNDIRTPVESCIIDRDLEDTINYMVTTKGVPLRVSGSSSQHASVDSELGLILGPMNSSIGKSNWKESPYFDADEAFTHEKFGTYIVTRLTAFTLEEVKGLIDLADNSTGSRGTFLLDEGGPYAAGDQWISAANDTLTEKGYDVTHDDTNVHQMHHKDVSGYASWGSNDGNYSSQYISNSGFETDNDPADGIPDKWITELDGGVVGQTMDDAYSGTHAAKIERTVVTPGDSVIGQWRTILPDTRYYMRGYANLSGVSNDGGVHLFIRAYDSTDTLVTQYNGSFRTGTTNQWVSLGQVKFEPLPDVSKVMVGAAMSESTGVVYLDGFSLRLIKPNNTYVPGAIGETFVSTGGRSFNYATGYGQSLVADLIREGISGISGHVYEPYLTACGRPQILFDRYTAGYTMGESFYMALPFYSWQEVVVGDPKMVPYWDVPDPAVADNITISVIDPAIDDDVTVRAFIYNRGGDATNVEVEFYEGYPNGGKKLGDTTVITSLARGQSMWLERTYSSPVLKSVIISVVVDYSEKIQEQKEDNNQATISFLVSNRPDVVLWDTDIVFSTDDVVQGDPVNVNVTTYNLGGVSTNMTGTVTLTELNGTFTQVHDILVDPMAKENTTLVLDLDINTSAMAGDLCVNVSLSSSRPEESLLNNDAGACIFIKILGFSVQALTEELETPPFGQSTHSFNVTNNGNIPDYLTMTYEASNSLWAVDLSAKEMELGPNETRTVQLRTTANVGLKYKDEVEVNVTIGSDNTDMSRTLSFRSVLGPSFEVVMTIAEPEVEALPGQAVDIEVVLGNLGNADDNVTIGTEAPGNWTVTFDEDLTVLAPGIFLTRIVTVTVPPEALADEFVVITLTGMSEKGAEDQTADIYVTVLQTFNISLEHEITAPIVIPVLTEHRAEVTVKNLGNGEDEMTLSTTATRTFPYSLEKNKVKLGAGEAMVIGILLRADSSTPHGNFTVTVKAKSSAGMEVEVSFKVTVIKSDLTLKITTSPSPSEKAGSTLLYTVEVWNQGDTGPGPFNLTMSVNGKEEGRKAVTGLNGSFSVTFDFEIEAKVGSYKVSFKVDAAGLVPEKDENNNEVTHQVTVKKRSSDGPGTSNMLIEPWQLAILIVVIIVVYLLIKIAYWSRTLKDAAKEGEEKRAAEADAAATKTEMPDDQTGPEDEPEQEPGDDEELDEGPDEELEEEPEEKLEEEPEEKPASEEEPEEGPKPTEEEPVSEEKAEDSKALDDILSMIRDLDKNE